MTAPTAWMPKGAKPAGMLASVKPPAGVTLAYVWSKTSILALWKSVA